MWKVKDSSSPSAAIGEMSATATKTTPSENRK